MFIPHLPRDYDVTTPFRAYLPLDGLPGLDSHDSPRLDVTCHLPAGLPLPHTERWFLRWLLLPSPRLHPLPRDAHRYVVLPVIPLLWTRFAVLTATYNPFILLPLDCWTLLVCLLPLFCTGSFGRYDLTLPRCAVAGYDAYGSGATFYTITCLVRWLHVATVAGDVGSAAGSFTAFTDCGYARLLPITTRCVTVRYTRLTPVATVCCPPVTPLHTRYPVVDSLRWIRYGYLPATTVLTTFIFPFTTFIRLYPRLPCLFTCFTYYRSVTVYWLPTHYGCCSHVCVYLTIPTFYIYHSRLTAVCSLQRFTLR